jgi:DNA-binding MarR family transcriptional regulator
MSTMAFMQLAGYMEAHIKELEKKGVIKRAKKPIEEQPYRV